MRDYDSIKNQEIKAKLVELDWVISKICEEMEILEGQEHEWNV